MLFRSPLRDERTPERTQNLPLGRTPSSTLGHHLEMREPPKWPRKAARLRTGPVHPGRRNCPWGQPAAFARFPRTNSRFRCPPPGSTRRWRELPEPRAPPRRPPALALPLPGGDLGERPASPAASSDSGAPPAAESPAGPRLRCARPAPLPSEDPLPTGQLPEIGRASCRERVSSPV